MEAERGGGKRTLRVVARRKDPTALILSDGEVGGRQREVVVASTCDWCDGGDWVGVVACRGVVSM